ncbi:Aste57867_10813 [Aphanomyces stellatus]|uniref:Aste57867_10813 protein n=1 Tax=Aphanomyces stellatus TaxID=120398 RepID=A0A485KRW1_9STRA|nr:hypothetical protein As57867_010773 [Aphanomyces stellatus]VFT87682.1 Aste57867_10813 [Aphanomyces stellatus]
MMAAGDNHVEDKVARKHLLNRAWSRENHRRKKLHAQYLREKVVELTRQLEANQPTSCCLPWPDVAAALRDAAADATRTKDTLQRGIQQNERLLCVMWQYCQGASPAAITSGGGGGILSTLHWRDFALFGDSGAARVASYTWLTERLYHNTELAMSYCPNDVASLEVTGHDGGALFAMKRKHMLVHASLSDCVHVIQSMHCPHPQRDAELLAEAFGDTVAHLDIRASSFVKRRFVSDTRAVFVQCELSHDAARPAYQGETRSTAWIVVDQLETGLCRVRDFRTMSQPTASFLKSPLDRLAHYTKTPVERLGAMEEEEILDAAAMQLRRRFECMDRNWNRQVEAKLSQLQLETFLREGGINSPSATDPVDASPHI